MLPAVVINTTEATKSDSFLYFAVINEDKTAAGIADWSNTTFFVKPERPKRTIVSMPRAKPTTILRNEARNAVAKEVSFILEIFTPRIIN